MNFDPLEPGQDSTTGLAYVCQCGLPTLKLRWGLFGGSLSAYSVHGKDASLENIHVFVHIVFFSSKISAHEFELMTSDFIFDTLNQYISSNCKKVVNC